MYTQILLARRYLGGRASRSLLTLLAVALGVAIMFGMNGILPAVQASFGESVRLSAHQVDLLVTPAAPGSFGPSVLEAVLSTPGVATAIGVLERPVQLPAALAIATVAGPPIERLVVSGWDTASAAEVLPFRAEQGRLLQPGERGAALVRRSLVERTGLGLGDTLSVPSAGGVSQFAIVGVLPARVTFGDEEITVPLADAQALFGAPGRLSAVVGQVAPGADEEAVRAQLADRLGPGFALGAVQAGASEWAEILALAEAVFTSFGVLALAMGGFIMFATFRTSVAERRRDLGMLRAIGASQRSVLGLVLSESLLLGGLGTALGMLLGAGLATALLPLISPGWERFFGAPLGAPGFSPQLIGLTLALGLGIPLLSGLLPARAAARVSPLEALRPAEAAADSRAGRRQALSGALLLALAMVGMLSGAPALRGLGALLFLVGLALASSAVVQPAAALLGGLIAGRLRGVGDLARQNMARQPARAAATTTAVMISLAALVALAGMSSSFTSGLLGYLERSMAADYLILPEALVLGQANVEAGPDLAERIAATPGIAGVTSLRRGEAASGGAALQLIGIDPVSYPRLSGLSFSQGDPAEAYAALAGGRATIINGVLAAQLGLGVGQQLTLETPGGPRSYLVVGVGADYLNARVATAYLAQSSLAADIGPSGDVLLMADLAADADEAATRAALLELVRAYPSFSLLDYGAWRASQLEANQARSSILYVLMGILAVPALLALANTLGISVLERTRELGMLRAIGATRGQVRLLVLAESLLLAGLGAALGIVGGIGLGYGLIGALEAAGMSFPYRFPLAGALVGTLLALAFGVLAALAPARRAARMEIVVALRDG